MLSLRIHVHVKFRAFGITFKEVDATLSAKDFGKFIPKAVEDLLNSIPQAFKHKIYDNHGILVEVLA